MEGIVSIENFRICSSTGKIDLCQFIEVTSEFENIGCRWYVFWRWYVSEQHWSGHPKNISIRNFVNAFSFHSTNRSSKSAPKHRINVINIFIYTTFSSSTIILRSSQTKYGFKKYNC